MNMGTFRVTAFVFPSHRYILWSPDVLEIAEALPANGKK